MYLQNSSHDPQCEEGIWTFFHINNGVVTQPMCKWVKTSHSFEAHFLCIISGNAWTFHLCLKWDILCPCHYFENLFIFLHSAIISTIFLIMHQIFFQSHFKANSHKLGEGRIIAAQRVRREKYNVLFDFDIRTLTEDVIKKKKNLVPVKSSVGWCWRGQDRPPIILK